MQISNKQLPPILENSSRQIGEKSVRLLPIQKESKDQEEWIVRENEARQPSFKKGEAAREETMILRKIRSEEPFNFFNNVSYAFESYSRNQGAPQSGALVNLLA